MIPFIHHSQNNKIIIVENRSVVRVGGEGLTVYNMSEFFRGDENSSVS